MASWPASLLDPRTVLDWKHCMLTRRLAGFSLDGRVLDEHVVWYVVDGACEVRTPDGAMTMRAGSALWIPPRVPHSASIPAGSRSMLHYTFRFGVLRDGRRPRLDRPAILRADARELEPDMRRLYEDHCLGEPSAADRARAALLLIYTTLTRQPGAVRPPGRLSPDERRRVVQYVRRHIARAPSSRDLAHELGLSLDRFARLFKATFGVAARRWLVGQRIGEACFRLTHSHRSVGAIAEELGYANRHLFNRQFRAATGRTPTAYRGGSR